VNAVARAEGSPERRFTEVMSRHGQAVLGYLARRTQPQHEAADLMAEVFTVAWRRLDQVPEPDEQARAWLIGVARGVLANHQRTAIRRTRLSDRIRAHLHTRPQAFIDTVGEQVEHVRRALGQLSAGGVGRIQLRTGGDRSGYFPCCGPQATGTSPHPTSGAARGRAVPSDVAQQDVNHGPPDRTPSVRSVWRWLRRSSFAWKVESEAWSSPTNSDGRSCPKSGPKNLDRLVSCYESIRRSAKRLAAEPR
jgi:hypothetical protein